MTVRALACLVVLAGSLNAMATVMVQVDPAAPDAATAVSLFPHITFGDTGYESVTTTWSLTGNVIDLKWYMHDLHGSGLNFIQILTPYSGQADVGLLAPGNYEVQAKLYMSNYPMYSMYAQQDEGVAFFQVVSEPATLCLLAPVLALLRTRRSR
jgi:hypothetical protein